MKKRQRSTIYFYIMGFIGIILIAYVVWFYGKQHKFLKYKSPRYHFSMSYPASWSIIENRPGIPVVFKSPRKGDLDSFVENVALEIRPVPREVTLEDYNAAALEDIKKTFGAFVDIREKKAIRMLGEEGYRIIFVGVNPDSQNMKILLQWVIRDGRVYQLAYMAQQKDFDEYFDEAQKIMRTFRLEE